MNSSQPLLVCKKQPTIGSEGLLDTLLPLYNTQIFQVLDIWTLSLVFGNRCVQAEKQPMQAENQLPNVPNVEPVGQVDIGNEMAQERTAVHEAKAVPHWLL